MTTDTGEENIRLFACVSYQFDEIPRKVQKYV